MLEFALVLFGFPLACTLIALIAGAALSIVRLRRGDRSGAWMTAIFTAGVTVGASSWVMFLVNLLVSLVLVAAFTAWVAIRPPNAVTRGAGLGVFYFGLFAGAAGFFALTVLSGLVASVLR